MSESGVTELGICDALNGHVPHAELSTCTNWRHLVTSVRDFDHSIEEDPNLETQFKSEVTNPPVRGREYPDPSESDIIIADLIEQLVNARRELEMWRQAWRQAQQEIHDLKTVRGWVKFVLRRMWNGHGY